jgi:adenosylcobinamide-phosphate guanylyltransferase
MCGGRGSRLDAGTEKPLVDVAGVSLIDRVVRAVQASRVDDVYAVPSPNAPATRVRVDGLDAVSVIETSGAGYVADLQSALDAIRCADDVPVLTVAADLPLLDGEVVDRVLDVYDTGSLTVASPASLPATLGLQTDAAFDVEGGQRVVPAGVNVVGGDPDDVWVSWDARLAVNLNYPSDVAVAERLLSGPPE